MRARRMKRSFEIGAWTLAFATIISGAGRVEAQDVVVQGTPAPPPPAGYAQPQPYYVQPAPPVYAPQPVYAQPVRSPRARTSTRPNIGLIVSGAVLLGVGWVSNIIVGLPAGDDPFTSGSEPKWETFRITSVIPIAGPWIQLGVKPTSFAQDYWGAWLIINGLMQASGLTMLIAGIATPRTYTEVSATGPAFEVALLPNIGPEHVGAALVGRF